MKVTQEEHDALVNRFNEVRSLCDSYLREIKQLNNTIDGLNDLIDSHSSLTYKSHKKPGATVHS